MSTPTPASIPQWEWTLVSTGIYATTLNNLTPGFDFYYTTRPSGGTAPTAIVERKLPRDAIKVFRVQSTNKNTVNKPDEFVLESQVLIDVYAFCFSRDNTVLTNGALLVRDGIGNSLPVNPLGGLDVRLQDQTTPSVIAKFNQVHDSTTLAAEALINQRDIVVTSSTGIVVGSYIILFSTVTERYYFGTATIISGAPTITLDTPLDSTFPAGTFVDVAITDMSVNGLITPQTFGLRGLGAPPGVDVKADITRILFTCVTASAVSLSLFADLPALLNGLVLRRRNGTNNNLFNVKSNRELAGLMFDFDVSVASNPVQGEDGFKTRFTITKTGVVARLPVGEDLELIVQDNYLGITILECMAEGHLVDEVVVV